jgi:hypothetical protein
MEKKNVGHIAQVIGPVIDVVFEKEENLPKIFDALQIIRENGEKLILEAQQAIGENTIRTIAMDSSEGLQRGMEVEALGHPISMPTGDDIKGRLFNVIGDAIDGLNYRITKATVKAEDAQGLVDIDNKNNAKDSNVDMDNMYFYDVEEGVVFDGVPAYYTSTFSNFEIAPSTVTVADYFKGGSEAYATAVDSPSTGVGADLTQFTATWSWAAAASAWAK